MMWGGKQYDHCPYSNVRYAQTAGRLGPRRRVGVQFDQLGFQFSP